MICNCVGCEERGKIIGWFADLPLCYCEHHSKFGITLLSFFTRVKKLTKINLENDLSLYYDTHPKYQFKKELEV